MSEAIKKQHGGARKGAGRKQDTEKRTNVDIYLSDKYYLDKVAKDLKVPKIKALRAIIDASKEKLA